MLLLLQITVRDEPGAGVPAHPAGLPHLHPPQDHRRARVNTNPGWQVILFSMNVFMFLDQAQVSKVRCPILELL